MAKCEEGKEDEWHWIVTQRGKAGPAPTHITAYFATAGEVQVPFEKVSGNVWHYTLFGEHLYDSLVAPGASIEIEGAYYDNWANKNPEGQLILSHMPCGTPPLIIEKTATTTWTRTWDWDIEKTASTTDLGEIEADVLYEVDYLLTVSGTSTDSDFWVSGTITVTNPDGNPDALIEDVEDVLGDDTMVSVSCEYEESSITFPYTLAGGESIDCTYEVMVDDPTLVDTNTATVVVDAESLVAGNQATVDVVWEAEPPTEIDACVMVTDTAAKWGDDVEVCASQLGDDYTYEIPYTMTFSVDLEADVRWQCGYNEYENTTSIYTIVEDGEQAETLASSSVTVSGYLSCPFCSYSQGYWFAKPGVEWGDGVALGGTTYSRNDGQDIWNIRGRYAGSDARQAFTQYSALMLSAESEGFTKDDLSGKLQWHLSVIEKYFLDNKSKGKLSNSTIASYPSDQKVRKAASYISDWISENHCDDMM